jgi:hypothetical protein
MSCIQCRFILYNTRFVTVDNGIKMQRCRSMVGVHSFVVVSQGQPVNIDCMHIMWAFLVVHVLFFVRVIESAMVRAEPSARNGG